MQQWDDDVMGEREIAEGVKKLPYFKVVADEPMSEQNDGTRDIGELYPFLICGGTNTERYYFMHINDKTNYKFNHESYFESLLYIKTNDNISQISKETYIDLVKAIYFDYYLFWYQPFMSNNEYIEYKKKVERVYQLVIQDVMNEMFCDISYVDCPLFHESGYIQPNTTLPVITRPQKKYLFLVVPGFIACTILIVWIYNTILVWLDIPINHVGAIIGNITSAIIATLSAIYFIKPKS